MPLKASYYQGGKNELIWDTEPENKVVRLMIVIKREINKWKSYRLTIENDK